MEFSRQEYWSVWPFPSPGDLPDPGIEPRSHALLVYSLLAEPPGELINRAGYIITLALYSISREVPGSVLKCETVLGTLDATRKDTQLSLKESTEVPGTTSSEPFLSS